MSSISKLSVSGIRSFPPDEFQTIVFGSPLTVILGSNGSGKTTLIESLKYATTGDKPPGTGQGQSFVYDPKLRNDTTVRAQVRLEFNDVQNQHFVVCRSLEAVQKAKKIEMKTLDNTLSKKVGDKIVSVNKKCADIDAEVVDSLGVSKAILTNVIFCHQEDSCWPLDEGKKVKEKFDAIFNADRYMKCIKLHQDIQKSLKEKLGLIKVDIGHLKKRKEDALTSKRRIAEEERRLAEFNESIIKYEEQMAPLNTQLKDVQRILQEINTVALELNSKKKDLENVQKMQQVLLRDLDEEFQGTDSELAETISNFETDMAEKGAYCKQQETKVLNLTSQIEALQRKRTELLVQVGKMRGEHAVYEQNKTQLFTDIREAVGRYQLSASVGPGDLTDTEVAEVLRELSMWVKEAKEKLDKLKLDEEDKINKHQLVIQGMRDEKTKTESQVNTKESQFNELEVTKTRLRNRLVDLSVGSSRMDKLERDLKQVTDELKKKEDEMDIQASESEVSELKDRLVLQSEIESKLDTEKSRLHEQSTARAKYDLLAKQLEEKKQAASRLKLAHEDMLMNLLAGEIRDDDLRFQFDHCQTRLSREVQDQEREIHRGQMQLESLKKERHMLENQLASKEDEVRNLKHKVNEVTRVETLEAELAKVQADLKMQQEQKGLNDSLVIHYEDFIKKLKQKKCCPLCHQGFPGDNQVDELVSELKLKISKTPVILEQFQKRIQDLSSKQERLLTLRPSVEKIRDLEAKDLPDLKVKLQKLGTDIQGLTNSIEEREESITFAKMQESSAKNIQGEVVLLCQHVDEIRKLTTVLERERNKLGIGHEDVSRPLPQVTAEHEAAKREQQELQSQVNTLQTRINKYRVELAAITERKNKFQEEKIKIGQGLQEKQGLEKQLEDINKQAAELEAEIEKKKLELPTLSRRLAASENKMTELKKYGNRRIDEASNQLAAQQSIESNLRALNASVHSWVESGRDQRLQENEQSLESVQNREQHLCEEKKKFEELLSEAKSRVDQQKAAQRNLLDNKRLREMKSEEVRVKRDCDRLKDTYRSYNYDKVKLEEESLQRKRSDLNSRIQSDRGGMSTLQLSLTSGKREYEKQYKSVESDFKEKVFEERVNHHAIEDLNKNRVALEWAIAKFHEERMLIINKRIKELWRDIYKGTDIDYVMIRTDEVDAATAGTEKRRQHTYRVVMFKSSVELDMRGRCSAGQKMLASIIIRMALAETFSGSCGVLTLDEPTTNLDRENIESLCQALTSIADRHSGQKNFQLIVITHDETFLDSISRTAYLDHYFKVKRDKNGNSQVRKVAIAHS